MCSMSTQWERLNSELLKKHKSWASLANYLGLKKPNVGNWKSRGIPAKYLRKCAEFVSKSHDWLDLGDESIKLDANYQESKPNQALAVELPSSAAININVNKNERRQPINLLTDLSAALEGLDPDRVELVATMMAALVRKPSDKDLCSAIAILMDSQAFLPETRKVG